MGRRFTRGRLLSSSKSNVPFLRGYHRLTSEEEGNSTSSGEAVCLRYVGV